MIKKMMQHTLISAVAISLLAGGFTVMVGNGLKASQSAYDQRWNG